MNGNGKPASENNRPQKGKTPPLKPPVIERTPQPLLKIFDFDPASVREIEPKDAKECFPYQFDKKTTTWINVDNLKDPDLVTGLCEGFGIHPLVIDDILHTRQRPKMEDYGSYIYIVIRMLGIDEKRGTITSEQISMILGSSFLITFQETPGDVFDGVRDQIRSGKGRVRRMGPDFLAYTLMDSIVDNYFIILERLGERIESLEEDLIKAPDHRILSQVHRIKKQMAQLRKSVWPTRELVSALERKCKDKSPLIKKETSIYLRDLYDHSIQLIETIETERDLISGMIDIYLSSVSNRLNEVMKVLTVISTIFIPLTFITGLYGMNFEAMPELGHPFGYPAVLALMVALGIGMAVYFKRKGWF